MCSKPVSSASRESLNTELSLILCVQLLTVTTTVTIERNRARALSSRRTSSSPWVYPVGGGREGLVPLCPRKGWDELFKKWSENAPGSFLPDRSFQSLSYAPLPPRSWWDFTQPARFFVPVVLDSWRSEWGFATVTRGLWPPQVHFQAQRGRPRHGLRAQPQRPGDPPLESASPASYLAQGPNGICPSVDRKLILIKSSQRSGSIQCQQQMESVSDPSKVSLDEVAW